MNIQLHSLQNSYILYIIIIVFIFPIILNKEKLKSNFQNLNAVSLLALW